MQKYLIQIDIKIKNKNLIKYNKKSIKNNEQKRNNKLLHNINKNKLMLIKICLQYKKNNKYKFKI